ncbi:hypothetical protein OsI_21057 [Oryza sativa Indica Group]|uniref:DUF3615 domain-containing protein n=1 Tax=Oryza sativa subsp. indica TaxID=39946 RepID=A2Y7N8_ORYSI|nr:hypothetical protein OsI_21057 [Oryza sativa Indica Group]
MASGDRRAPRQQRQGRPARVQCRGARRRRHLLPRGPVLHDHLHGAPPPESSGLTYCHYNLIASCEATGSAAWFFAEVEVDDGGQVCGGEDGVVACCILQNPRDYSVNCNACFRQRSYLTHPDRNKFIAGHRLLPEHREDDCEIEYDYGYPYFD